MSTRPVGNQIELRIGWGRGAEADRFAEFKDAGDVKGMEDKKPVSDEVAEICISAISESSPFERRTLSYEIQNDFNFILISAVTDGVGNVSPLDRKRIASLVDGIVPKRSGEYSWMINFILDGVIFDSYFGGDVMSPDSGL